MESLLATIQQTDLATALRFSRWSYAAVNATHILGIALLVGAILPLDLRLLGCWPGVNRTTLVRVLVPTAATGLALAVLTGILLFSIRATEYADLAIFRIKLVLIMLGAGSAILLHLRHGFTLETASAHRLRWAGFFSLCIWPCALLAGRMIAFVGD
ncbi:MAG: hypothetical protein AAFY56_09995 [Pseudomonadota bacterium]